MSKSNALRQIGFYAGMILIVLALYVLSMGPANILWHRTRILEVRDGIEVIYYPLTWLIMNGKGEFISRYVALWEPSD